MSKTTGKTKKGIIPLGDRVLLKPIKKEEKKTLTGIIIPDTAREEKPQVGKVIAVGPGRRADDGTLVPPGVKVGNTVLFAKYGPDEVKIDDEEFLIVSESSILAIIK